MSLDTAARRRVTFGVVVALLVAGGGMASCASFSSADGTTRPDASSDGEGEAAARDGGADSGSGGDSGSTTKLIDDTFGGSTCEGWTTHSNMALSWSPNSRSGVGGSCKLCLVADGFGKTTKTLVAPAPGVYTVTAWLEKTPKMSASAIANVGFQRLTDAGVPITQQSQSASPSATWMPYSVEIRAEGAPLLDVVIAFGDGPANDCLEFDDVTVDVR